MRAAEGQFHRAREDDPGGAFQTEIGQMILPGFGAVDDGDRSAVAFGDQRELGRGIDDQ